MSARHEKAKAKNENNRAASIESSVSITGMASASAYHHGGMASAKNNSSEKSGGNVGVAAASSIGGSEKSISENL